jgi:hypothetical protein
MNDITCGMVKGWVMERLAIAIKAKLKEKNTRPIKNPAG